MKLDINNHEQIRWKFGQRTIYVFRKNLGKNKIQIFIR